MLHPLERTVRQIKQSYKTIRTTSQYSDYRNTLYDKTVVSQTRMKGIRSNLHQSGTYKRNKTSLSCFDEGRYILDGDIYLL